MFLDGHIDIGAQWIHGEQGNVVFQMASAHNLVSDRRDTIGQFINSTFITSSGSEIKSNKLSEYLSLFYSLMEISPKDDLEKYMSLAELFQKRYYIVRFFEY